MGIGLRAVTKFLSLSTLVWFLTKIAITQPKMVQIPKFYQDNTAGTQIQITTNEKKPQLPLLFIHEFVCKPNIYQEQSKRLFDLGLGF